MTIRDRVWMGAFTLVALGLFGGCPEEKPPTAIEGTGSGAEVPTEAAESPPTEPAFVAAAFPAQDESLMGAWAPVKPLDALAGLNLVKNGMAQQSKKFPGQSFPTSTMGKWEAAGAGVRVTLTVGQITEINQFEYGTVDGVPRLRWSGKTLTFTGAEGVRGEQVHTESPVLLHLPTWKNPG